MINFVESYRVEVIVLPLLTSHPISKFGAFASARIRLQEMWWTVKLHYRVILQELLRMLYSL